MRSKIGLWAWFVVVGLVGAAVMTGCGGEVPSSEDSKPAHDGIPIILLHHSTGGVIWDGGVADWFDEHNSTHGTDYYITERAYPTDGYPWENYPYDYWNIWVDHAGKRRYKKQDTLEILTQDYDVIVWKHCFPVGYLEPDSDSPDVTSTVKSAENYRLQYQALKDKMHQFPETQFIVWTGAALVEAATDEESAGRADQFFNWVIEVWDEPEDNIYVWDFWQLETEGGLFLLDQHTISSTDSHPNDEFASTVAPLLAQRIIDVIEGRGDTSNLTGQ